MPRGHAASLPSLEGHRRPSHIDGLVVKHVNETGTKSASYDFSKLPLAPPLQYELMTVFAARANPTGRWRNLPSSEQAFWAVGFFARWLTHQQRVPSKVSDIDPATWLRWRLEHLGNVASRRAVRLTGMLLLDTGLLRPETRQEVIRRIPRDQPDESSYTDEELRQIVINAKRVWRIARDRIRYNLRHLESFRAGCFQAGSRDALVGQALDYLAANGDVPRVDRKDKAPQAWVKIALGGGRPEQTWKRLYLDEGEVMAAIVLIACREGWNATTIQELKVPDRVDGDSSHPLYRIELEKRRRRAPFRFETRTLSDHGPNTTGRLLRHIIEVTQPARTLLDAQGHPSDRLFLFHGAKKVGTPVPIMIREVIGDAASQNYAKASGRRVNLRRIRKTVNNRHRREANQNTRETHDAVYLLSDPHTVLESEGLIARGIERAVEHAESLLAEVKDADGNEGEDTPTAKCLDLEKSPYSPWGVACTASFLLCLACHNAVVMPKHLGRLAYLHKALTSRRESLPPEIWTVEWAAHYARLHNLRTEHYSEGQWRQALEGVSEEDRTLVDHLLKGDLDS